MRISTKAETIRKYQADVTELKSTIIELKITPQGFSSRLDKAEEKSRGLEHRAVGLIQPEQQ